MKDECIENQLTFDKISKLGFGKDLNEEYENEAAQMMRELEAFYKKHTDYNFMVVQKGALEMNMFSNERVTFEGMIKQTQNKEKAIVSPK